MEKTEVITDNYQSVTVSRGEVMGIGKVKIPRTDLFNYEIPMLSFIVIKEPDGNFVSSCIHLHTDGYGAEVDNCIDDMIDSIKGFLESNFKKLSSDEAWKNLKMLSHADEGSTELWDAYRDIQYNLAAMGIPSDSAESLRKRMEQLQQRIDWLVYENAKLKGVLHARPISSPSPIVDYTPIKRVA